MVSRPIASFLRSPWHPEVMVLWIVGNGVWVVLELLTTERVTEQGVWDPCVTLNIKEQRVNSVSTFWHHRNGFAGLGKRAPAPGAS